MTATLWEGSVSTAAMAARRPAPPPPTTSTSQERSSRASRAAPGFEFRRGHYDGGHSAVKGRRERGVARGTTFTLGSRSPVHGRAEATEPAGGRGPPREGRALPPPQRARGGGEHLPRRPRRRSREPARGRHDASRPH